MHALKLKTLTAVAATGAMSLGLSYAVLAGPPVAGFNAAQEAVRMSIVHSMMLARTTAANQKAAATNQKATTATHTTGQPNQTCGSPTAPETPGHAASAPGSAFNSGGNRVGGRDSLGWTGAFHPLSGFPQERLLRSGFW